LKNPTSSDTFSTEMETIAASIDIGSHTARLLIVQVSGVSGQFRPLARKRVYTRLAEGFHPPEGQKSIQPGAIDRTLQALLDFRRAIDTFKAREVYAVATGVVREAANREVFLRCLGRETGIQATALTGEEEALLTGKGVLHALGERSSVVIFDLGGASTEFLFHREGKMRALSLPLGAAILTTRYLRSDPPEEGQLEALSRRVARILEGAPLDVPEQGEAPVGTGGTVTTLAAMLYGIPRGEISPERVNGLVLDRDRIKGLYHELKGLTIQERLGFRGLDSGRADVIVAGMAVVLGVLRHFEALELRVSMSDLLEGILIQYLGG